MATRKKDKRTNTDPQNNTQKNKDWDELNQVHQNELIETQVHQNESIETQVHQNESIQTQVHQNESIETQVHQNESIESWYFEMSLHNMKIAFIRNSPDKTVDFFYIPDSIIRSYVFNKNYLTCDGD